MGVKAKQISSRCASGGKSELFRHCTLVASCFSPAWAPRPQRFVYNACMSFRAPPGNPNAATRSRTPPPEDTFEEAAFLKLLGEKQDPVSVKLMDGQIDHGWI